MVRGLDVFKEAFKDHGDCYVIIGGTACDLALDEAGLVARATKDIDMILVVEALTPEFGKMFWDFVQAGEYEQLERSPDKLEYFRFLKPKKDNYPRQLELFARIPDAFLLPDEARLTPIPLDDGLTSLSAILMDEEYYQFTLDHSDEDNGVHMARPYALIPLKARAYLNLKEDKDKGADIDSRNIKKHKTDVFRLALLLTDAEVDVPDSIKATMIQFINEVAGELPDKKWFKDVGAGNVDPNVLLDLLKKVFTVND